MGDPRCLTYDAVLGRLKPTTADLIDFNTFGTHARIHPATLSYSSHFRYITRSRSAAGANPPRVPPPQTTPIYPTSRAAPGPQNRTQGPSSTITTPSTRDQRRSRSPARTITTTPPSAGQPAPTPSGNGVGASDLDVDMDIDVGTLAPSPVPPIAEPPCSVGSSAEGQLRGFFACYSHPDWTREQQAESL